VDVVELSGNHENDYSRKSLMYTLDIYDQHHIQYFAGGRNLEEARKPLLIENHGNKIAFIGCNPPGPDYDWATATGAGSAPCDDLVWEVNEIKDLRAQGYLTIATFQYNESYAYTPGPWQMRDFRKVSEAGAVVVSGSQAHFPQTFEFDGGNLIHYGLGNLFFDQMAPIIDGRRIHGTEREFLDRHIFYDGRYLGTELLTAMLEDYAKPRPMTADERQSLLTDVFTASGWLK
jgi:poly-gamma-glutamate capsule biosynthesis protein CapA/YwtB (metallophosphatase superfamily)